MANNYVVRDGNGALLTKSSIDMGGGVEADRVQATDGTNFTPTMDAVARPGFMKNTDGVNVVGTASLATAQGNTQQTSMLVTGPGEKVATDKIVTGTTTPDAALSAPGAGTIYVVHWLSISLAATADQAPLQFQLIQDAAGTPVVLWQGMLAALAKTTAEINLVGVNIPQTVANKTLDLKVVAGTIVSTNYIAVNFGATTAV